jgi:metal-responsive CopG/Arc/MetJ family transcriptional regulator
MDMQHTEITPIPRRRLMSRRISVRMPLDLHDALIGISRSTSVDESEIIRVALRRFIAQHHERALGEMTR